MLGLGMFGLGMFGLASVGLGMFGFIIDGFVMIGLVEIPGIPTGAATVSSIAGVFCTTEIRSALNAKVGLVMFIRSGSLSWSLLSHNLTVLCPILAKITWVIS